MSEPAPSTSQANQIQNPISAAADESDPQSAQGLPAEQPQTNPDSTLTNTQRDRLAHRTQFQYGNYHTYYKFRTETVPDARLQLLDRSLFEGATVLDLGCNAGKLTLEAVTCLGARRAVGLDIDPVLIDQAHEAARVAGLSEDPRVRFVEADFMPPRWFDEHASSLLPEGESFSLILLLSITKWLHLHAGDAGLLALFSSLARLLAPGGALVVEPQEWANYKAAVKKAKNLRAVFQNIKVKPDFEEEIGATGLVLKRKIAREEGGFSRPLMVWRKHPI